MKDYFYSIEMLVLIEASRFTYTTLSERARETTPLLRGLADEENQ